MIMIIDVKFFFIFTMQNVHSKPAAVEQTDSAGKDRLQLRQTSTEVRRGIAGNCLFC